MAEIDLEQTIEDDVQISLDENNEFNDLEEVIINDVKQVK